MAERPKHWIKLWVSWLTTPAHLELSGGALGLGPLLLLLATWDGEYDSGGWLLGEGGRPMSRDAIARAVHLTRTHLDRYLSELMACNTLTFRESDGAIGFAKFGRWQETRNAKYNRTARKDAHASAHGVQASEQQTVDDRRQTTELATQATPPTPSRGVSSESPAEAAFLSHPPAKVPTKPTKPRADLPPGLAEHVLAELVKACRELDGPTAGPRNSATHPPFVDALRKVHGTHAPTAEEWTLVIRERLAMSQAGDSFGSLTIASLCAPANFERWLAAARARTRGGPKHSRGAAPPSPRPTRSGYHDPKTGQFVEDDFESVGDFLLETET
ncbi:MAG: hypothetical protein ACRCZP_19825 [Phycicoccus sp.]